MCILPARKQTRSNIAKATDCHTDFCTAHVCSLDLESDLPYPATKIDEAVSVVEDLHQDWSRQTSALRA